MTLTRVLLQEDQDFTLFCECHNLPQERLYVIRDDETGESTKFCLSSAFKEAAKGMEIKPFCGELVA